MAKILEHRKHGVTLGVLDKTFSSVEHLVSVTFEDVHGAIHTVFAHRNGPFKTAHQIAAAWEEGTLHPHERDPNADDKAAATSQNGGD